jgi:hypothetical protein
MRTMERICLRTSAPYYGCCRNSIYRPAHLRRYLLHISMIIRPKMPTLDAFRRALRGRATEAQKRILDATVPLLTSEEIGNRLGYNSGRRMPNNMKRDRELLAISVAQKRGKIKRFLSRRS